MTPDDRSGGRRGAGTGDPLSEPGAPLGDPLFSEPNDEARTIGDEGLLEILEAAIGDERAAQAKYRRGLRALRRPAGLRDVRAAPRATSRRTNTPCSRATPRSRSVSASAEPDSARTDRAPAHLGDRPPTGATYLHEDGGAGA